MISNGPAGLGELTTDLAAVKAEGEAAVATEAMDVDGEEPEVESEESSQVKKKAPAKRSKKGGKGKEKVKDQDPEVDETGTPVGSDHEDGALLFGWRSARLLTLRASHS